MSKVFYLLLGLGMAILTSASHVAAEPFTFERYFKGKSSASGSFRAINGTTRDFEVALTGRWDGTTLNLREDFVFDDGTRDTKTWRFVKTGPTTYRGTREDVIGETEVTLSGNTARFTYQVYLDPQNRAQKVRFHDLMTLRPDGTVLNTAWVTKLGLPVARTRVEFRRD